MRRDAIAFPHSPQNFKAFSNFAPQWGHTFAVSAFAFGAVGTAGVPAICLTAVHLGEDNRQLGLHIFLGPLIILVRQLADSILELQIAQILVDRGFARLPDAETD